MSDSNTDEEITNTDDELLVRIRVLRTLVRVVVFIKTSVLERCSTQYRMENSKKSIYKSFWKT